MTFCCTSDTKAANLKAEGFYSKAIFGSHTDCRGPPRQWNSQPAFLTLNPIVRLAKLHVFAHRSSSHGHFGTEVDFSVAIHCLHHRDDRNRDGWSAQWLGYLWLYVRNCDSRTVVSGTPDGCTIASQDTSFICAICVLHVDMMESRRRSITAAARERSVFGQQREAKQIQPQIE